MNLFPGVVNQATSQRIEIEGSDAGSFDLEANHLSWTGIKGVSVADGRLTVRIFLKEDGTFASLSEILFNFRDRRDQ